MYWMKSKLKKVWKLMIVPERLLGEGVSETTTIDVAVVVAAERKASSTDLLPDLLFSL